MSVAWLVLYLGGLVHLLALNGYGLERASSWIVLAPVAAALALPPFLRGRTLPPWLLRAAGLAGFACALVFVKTVYLDAWDSQDLGPNMAMAGAGLGSLLPALAAEDRPGAGTWLWIAFWLGAGLLDPSLPVLGAGLAGMLEGSGMGLGAKHDAGDAPVPWTWPAMLLLGLALPKPWWDFGIERDWAWASAAVGAGAALSTLPAPRRLLARTPRQAPAWILGLLTVLYSPALAVPWGLVLGIAAGTALDRLYRPGQLHRLTGPFLLGLLLSFVLHANAWLPGLRHLVWIGN